MEPSAFRLYKSARENDERPQDDEKSHHYISGNRRAKVLHRNLVVDDHVRKDANSPNRIGEQQDAEEPLCLTHESQSAGFVRMRRKEVHIEFGDAIEKLKPQKEPPEPSQHQELEQWHANQQQPPARPCVGNARGDAVCPPC